MIGCDYCPRWFHGSCVGITEEESLELDWICPECTQKSSSPTKRASDTEIDILMQALQGIHAEAAVKRKKLDTPQEPKIAVYHLSPEKAAQSQIVGYLVNQSQASPTPENGSIVYITPEDLERGYIITDWGGYRIKQSPDYHIQLQRDFTLQKPEKTVFIAVPDPIFQIPMTKFEILRGEQSIQFNFTNLEPISLQIPEV